MFLAAASTSWQRFLHYRRTSPALASKCRRAIHRFDSANSESHRVLWPEPYIGFVKFGADNLPVVSYDWLGHYLLESIAEVQEHATRWIWTYNHERPNMALGGITPKQKFALAA